MSQIISVRQRKYVSAAGRGVTVNSSIGAIWLVVVLLELAFPPVRYRVSLPAVLLVCRADGNRQSTVLHACSESLPDHPRLSRLSLFCCARGRLIVSVQGMRVKGRQ